MTVKITKKIFLLLFLVLFIETGFAGAHPIYLSLCQIDYNAENHSLEISVKIFADDLLNALRERKQTDLHLGEQQENQKTNEYIFNYLKDNLDIKIDNKPVTVSYVGKEMEDSAVWCFLEVTDIASFSKIQVTDQILTEIYDSQSNVVQVNNKGKILNLLLKKDNPSGELSF